MCAWSIVFVIICLTLFVPFIWDLSFVSCFVFSFRVFVLIPFNAITSDLWNCSLTSVGPEPLEWKCWIQDCQRTPNPRKLLISENSNKGLHLYTRPSITQLLAAPSAGCLTQTTSKTKQTQPSADTLLTDTRNTTSHSPVHQGGKRTSSHQNPGTSTTQHKAHKNHWTKPTQREQSQKKEGILP